MVGPELHQCAVEKGVVVLQSMSLIYDQRGPGETAEKLFVLEEDLVRREESVEL